MEEDDYEGLPSASSMGIHMLAGAAAGISEHSVMYPVDCVKTRMQCLVPDPKANYKNVADALYRIVRYEGVGNTLRGIDAMIYGAGPAHAMYFACYEEMKKLLSSSGRLHGNHLANGAAGCFATVLHDAVMNPADVVKQRMQVYGSPYKNCLECTTSIYRQEGIRAFYRSYGTQLTMNIPFQSLHFVVYEYCQDHLNRDRHYSPKSHIVSGAMAGAVAAAATTPLDVCKTLLNTQERCAVSKGDSTVRGLVEAVRTVYQFQGWSGFFRGVSARVIYQMPSTAIAWSVYEFFKAYLSNRSDAESDGYVPASSVAKVHVHAAVTPPDSSAQ